MLALFTPNCIDTPVVTWGAQWAGGIVSPANPGYTADELAFQLKDSGAKALVTQLPVIETARAAAKKVGLPEDRIILIGDQKDASMKFKHFTSIRNTSGATRYRRTKIDPEKDLAFLVYSSGTTGHPKGVMLCHRNIVANTLQIIAGETPHLTHEDRILAFLPFFHIYGMSRNRLVSARVLTMFPQVSLLYYTKECTTATRQSSCPSSILRISAALSKKRRSHSAMLYRPLFFYSASIPWLKSTTSVQYA